jgi:hypothetical protein
VGPGLKVSDDKAANKYCQVDISQVSLSPYPSHKALC